MSIYDLALEKTDNVMLKDYAKNPVCSLAFDENNKISVKETNFDSLTQNQAKDLLNYLEENYSEFLHLSTNNHTQEELEQYQQINGKFDSLIAKSLDIDEDKIVRFVDEDILDRKSEISAIPLFKLSEEEIAQLSSNKEDKVGRLLQTDNETLAYFAQNAEKGMVYLEPLYNMAILPNINDGIIIDKKVREKLDLGFKDSITNWVEYANDRNNEKDRIAQIVAKMQGKPINEQQEQVQSQKNETPTPIKKEEIEQSIESSQPVEPPAQHKYEAEERLKKMLNSEDWHDRCKAVEVFDNYNFHETISSECFRNTLNKLVNDENHFVRAEVAKYGYGLDELVNDEVINVREAVAKAAGIYDRGDLLEKLIDDESELASLVREYAVYPAAKLGRDDLLEKLSNDESDVVRGFVADEGYYLDKLANDESAHVRVNVAEAAGKLGREDLLEKLANDKNEEVRKEVARQGFALEGRANNDVALGQAQKFIQEQSLADDFTEENFYENNIDDGVDKQEFATQKPKKRAKQRFVNAEPQWNQEKQAETTQAQQTLNQQNQNAELQTKPKKIDLSAAKMTHEEAQNWADEQNKNLENDNRDDMSHGSR